jgi:hypothetical protein
MATGEVVAVKVLASDSSQGEREFQTEVYGNLFRCVLFFFLFKQVVLTLVGVMYFGVCSLLAKDPVHCLYLGGQLHGNCLACWYAVTFRVMICILVPLHTSHILPPPFLNCCIMTRNLVRK